MIPFDIKIPLALGLVAAVATLPLAEGTAEAAVGYVRSNVAAPWGSTTNEEAMDLVFMPGGWDDLRYETVDPLVLLSPTYTFLYMEGSDSNAMELEAFLLANQAALEAWVDAGGDLFLNAAPNEGANQNWGFGGVLLTYPGFGVNPGTAVDPAHPIWNGPFLPTALMFTGGSYAHASVSGPGLVDLIQDANGDISTALLPAFGSGNVVFGGLTTSNFWSPAPESLNLRANIISFLAGDDSDMDGLIDALDNCPEQANPMQEDMDMDGLGDICDPCPDDVLNDADDDMACDSTDNCLGLANPIQLDDDMDGAGNACDECPGDPDDDIDGDLICGDMDNCPLDINVNQADDDMDGIGDLCDDCPGDPVNDPDEDGICADVDNCPDDANPDQADEDGDGEGDVCDESGAESTGGPGGDTDGPGDTTAGPSDDTTSGNPGTGGPGDDSGTSGVGTTGGTTVGGDRPTPDGCACTSDPTPGGQGGRSAWWLMVVAGIVARKRRRAA